MSSPRPLLRGLARIRYQLVFGCLLTVIIPVEFVGSGLVSAAGPEPASHALAIVSLAVLGGYLALRRIVFFPGIHVLAAVLPAFLASYGAAAAGLLLIYLEGVWPELLVSFFAALCFFSYALVIERRVKRRRFAYLPVGDLSNLTELSEVDWLEWTSTDQPPLGVDAVVADLRADLGPEREAMLTDCVLNGVRVYHHKQVYETLAGRVQIEHLSENSLGSLNPSSIYINLKRVCDVVGAVVALPIVVPLLAVLAVAIRRESSGPVFYTQRRMGYRGKTFKIWKLRTMRENVAGALYTEGGDERVTSIGRTLRKHRIDELPQIYNILRGEMSWIGPRPESIKLYKWYAGELGFYDYRHIVRPGISGWAQVRQGWAALPEDVLEKLHYDFYYIKNFSPWLDFVIAVQTVRVILTGFGSR